MLEGLQYSVPPQNSSWKLDDTHSFLSAPRNHPWLSYEHHINTTHEHPHHISHHDATEHTTITNDFPFSLLTPLLLISQRVWKANDFLFLLKDSSWKPDSTDTFPSNLLIGSCLAILWTPQHITTTHEYPNYIFHHDATVHHHHYKQLIFLLSKSPFSLPSLHKRASENLTIRTHAHLSYLLCGSCLSIFRTLHQHHHTQPHYASHHDTTVATPHRYYELSVFPTSTSPSFSSLEGLECLWSSVPP